MSLKKFNFSNKCYFLQKDLYKTIFTFPSLSTKSKSNLIHNYTATIEEVHVIEKTVKIMLFNSLHEALVEVKMIKTERKMI